MTDREQEQRERAYRLWEEEGRPEGSHDDHWKRSEHPADMSDQESDDVTKVNQQADAAFVERTMQRPTMPPQSGLRRQSRRTDDDQRQSG